MAWSDSEKLRIGLSGGEALVAVDVTPDSATGNFTISDAASVYPVGVIDSIEADASGSQVTVRANQDDSTSNQVNCELLKADNTQATAFKKFRVLCKIVT